MNISFLVMKNLYTSNKKICITIKRIIPLDRFLRDILNASLIINETCTSVDRLLPISPCCIILFCSLEQLFRKHGRSLYRRFEEGSSLADF